MATRVREIVAIAFLLLTIGCAGEPRLIVDKSGAGDSEIGMVVGRNYHQNETGLDKRVLDFLAEKKLDSSSDKVARLESFGFSCPVEAKPICRYYGAVDMKLVGEGVSPDRNATSITFKIAVDYSKAPATVATSIDKKHYPR